MKSLVVCGLHLYINVYVFFFSISLITKIVSYNHVQSHALIFLSISIPTFNSFTILTVNENFTVINHQ